MTEEQKPTVMVVDDEQLYLDLVHSELAAQGYEVVTATSGPAALNILQKIKPRIIISDLRMPGMNGFDFIVEARKLPNSSSVPFLILTGIEDYRAVQVGKNFGVKDFLLKPIEVGQLGQTVERMLKEP